MPITSMDDNALWAGGGKMSVFWKKIRLLTFPVSLAMNLNCFFLFNRCNGSRSN